MGLIWGIDVSASKHESISKEIASRCYELGLIIERVGRDDKVLKLMPPLTITMEELEAGCQIVKQAMQECFKNYATSESVLV
ncbi:Diaminobutyrate--2-oxoglutarate transaminase [compost metagenome]